jgi:hypothetical protein
MPRDEWFFSPGLHGYLIAGYLNSIDLRHDLVVAGDGGDQWVLATRRQDDVDPLTVHEHLGIPGKPHQLDRPVRRLDPNNHTRNDEEAK